MLFIHETYYLSVQDSELQLHLYTIQLLYNVDCRLFLFDSRISRRAVQPITFETKQWFVMV